MSKTFVLRFPTLCTSFSNPKVAKILVHPGSLVNRNSELIEIESSKGVIILQSEFSGIVSSILVKPEQSVIQGDSLIVISKD